MNFDSFRSFSSLTCREKKKSDLRFTIINQDFTTFTFTYTFDFFFFLIPFEKNKSSIDRRQSLRFELPSAEPDREKDNGFPDDEPLDLRPTIPEIKGRDRNVREGGHIEHRVPSNPGRPLLRDRQMPIAVRDSRTLASHHTPDQNYLVEFAVLQHPGEDRESVQGAQQSDNHHLPGLHKFRRAFRR